MLPFLTLINKGRWIPQHTLFAIKLNFLLLIFAEQINPEKIAPITMNKLVKRLIQSKFCTISPEYVRDEYMSRFAGNRATDKTVDMAVIVTESAKSALNILHHLSRREMAQVWIIMKRGVVC